MAATLITGGQSFWLAKRLFHSVFPFEVQVLFMSYQPASPVESNESKAAKLPEIQPEVPRRQHRRSKSRPSLLRRVRRRLRARVRWTRVALVVLAILSVIIVGTLALVVDSV